MDWLTFISKLVEALAWPLAAVALVMLLRDEIKQLVPILRRLKAGPLEAEFERGVKELTKAAPDAAVSPEEARPNTASREFLYKLAEMHPRSAVLEAWVRLEAAARAALATKGVGSTGYIGAARLAEPLVQKQLLNARQVEVFDDLRQLRNDAAHAVNLEPSTESARAYVDLASSIQGHLEWRTKDTGIPRS